MSNNRSRLQIWFRKLATYQTFPNNLMRNKIEFYFREVISCIIRGASFKKRYPYTHEFELFRNTKDLFAGSTAIVLGNGPSLASLDYTKLKLKTHNLPVVCAMNDFYTTELSKKITPAFYFLSDPAY